MGTEAGDEVGSDDDEALPGEFIGHLFGPVAQAEYLMNENNDGGFAADLGINDEGLDGAVVVLELDIFVVARRGLEPRPGPILCRGGNGGARNEEGSGKTDIAGKRKCHGKESSHNE